MFAVGVILVIIGIGMIINQAVSIGTITVGTGIVAAIAIVAGLILISVQPRMVP